MAFINLSDRWLQSATASERAEYTDAACPNLRVRIGKRSKIFSVMIGAGAVRRRVALGKYPQLSLAEARRKAAATTDDPASMPVAKKEARYGTVAELFDFVVAAMEAEGKTNEANCIYLRDGPLAAAKHFGEATLARNVRPADVTSWLREIHKAGIKLQHPRAYLSAAFGRAMKADNDPTANIGAIVFGIDVNPVRNVGGRVSAEPRNRKLSIDELKAFWRDFPAATSPHTAAAARMIIAMGGTRVSEVLCSRKEWWTTGAAPQLELPKTKNATAHVLPLPRAAAEQLLIARAIADPNSDYLYPHRLNASEPLSLNSLAQAVRRYCEDAKVEPFQPRDLRRTMKSHLLDSDADLREEWVDIWHNHGRHADVARKHYDRAEYTRAKQKVADAIDRIVSSILG
ncbi:MAG: integrase family protein [Blastocatellia bacterium]|nr:integrase family protein [Blastocatellia bacterium]